MWDSPRECNKWTVLPFSFLADDWLLSLLMDENHHITWLISSRYQTFIEASKNSHHDEIPTARIESASFIGESEPGSRRHGLIGVRDSEDIKLRRLGAVVSESDSRIGFDDDIMTLA